MKNTEMLKKNYEFKTVLTKGKYYSGEKIEAFILKNNKNKNLLGLAIGVKKGKAVERNKLKRQLRESYYEKEKNIEVGNSIVFLCKKGENIKKIKHEEVKKDMEKILKKAKILKEE